MSHGPVDDVHHELEHAQRLLQHAPDFILELGRDGVITYMNRPAPGRTLDDMIGTSVRQWMQTADHADFDRALHEVFTEAGPSSYESVGSVTGRRYIHRLSPVIEDGEVVSAILITHDVTELKDAKDELDAAQARYRAMVEACFDGLLLSIDGQVLDCNQALADILGRSRKALLGAGPTGSVIPEHVPLVMEKIRSGTEEPYVVTGLRPDGTRFPMELRGRNILLHGQPARLTAVRDLTEQRAQEVEQARREDRVRHAQKLETLGVLSGGVAHDFNNILATILANAEIALETGVAEKSLQRIRAAALRARGLTHQLMVYAGRGTRTLERIDLNRAVRDTMDLLAVSISKKAALEIALDPELPSVDGDASQISQVLVNLVTNASDALQGGTGRITVRTGTTVVDASRLGAAFASPKSLPGTYTMLEVVDSGCGLTQAEQVRIFDPFYTTKFAGRGLGLASAIGIVRAHGGLIEVISVPGTGSVFRVLLPPSTGQTPAPAGRAPTRRPAQTGTVLLADDEPALLEATRELLEGAGFDVLTATDGREALEQLAAHGDALRAVVLDVTMPRRNGLEVLAELRKRWTELPVVLTSGYADTNLGDQPSAIPHTVFLRKPFERHELLDALFVAGVR